MAEWWGGGAGRDGLMDWWIDGFLDFILIVFLLAGAFVALASVNGRTVRLGREGAVEDAEREPLKLDRTGSLAVRLLSNEGDRNCARSKLSNDFVMGGLLPMAPAFYCPCISPVIRMAS